MSRLGTEISDHGVSPFEKLDLGVTKAAEKYVGGALHVAGKVAGAGFHTARRVIGMFR